MKVKNIPLAALFQGNDVRNNHHGQRVDTRTSNPAERSEEVETRRIRGNAAQDIGQDEHSDRKQKDRFPPIDIRDARIHDLRHRVRNERRRAGPGDRVRSVKVPAHGREDSADAILVGVADEERACDAREDDEELLLVQQVRLVVQTCLGGALA